MKLGELDPLVIPLVNYFNKNGLTTDMSCQGHNKTNLSMFWIRFDHNITDAEIQEFLKMHLDWRGTFISCGRFAKRMLGFYGIDQQWHSEERWYYFAATQEAADADLQWWQSDDGKWCGFDGERYKKWIHERGGSNGKRYTKNNS